MRRSLVLAALLVFSGGCGGDDDGGAASTAGPAATNEATTPTPDAAESVDGDFDIPDGFPLADTIDAELAAFPIPQPSILSPALDFDASTDPRESLSQTVYSTLSLTELVEFYLDALPDAGFEFRAGSGGIEDPSEIEPEGIGNFIGAVHPDGHPAELVFAGRSNLSASQVQLVVYRAG